MSPPDTVAEEAKYEDLEKVVIGDTSEKFFQVGAQLLPRRRKSWSNFSKEILTYLHGTPAMLQD